MEGITLEEDQLIPPIAPDPPTLETSPEGVVLRWKGTGPSDLVSYLIYQRSTDTGSWTLIGDVLPEGDNLGDYTFVVLDASDASAGYGVVAVDVDGNRSVLAEAVGGGE